MSVSAAALRTSRRHVLATSAVAAALGGAAYYYRDRWMVVGAQRPHMPPPERRTSLFVAGDNVVIQEQPSYSPLVFRVYATVRLVLLCVRVVPVLWFMFLSYVGACPAAVVYEEVHDLIVKMGPSYIKLGQWLASRPDIFPPDLCRALSKLFDSAPPHSWAHTEAALREADVLRHFSSIETVPLNSGSVAQIHRAVLREDVDGIPAGTAMAVKVMHPHIRDLIAADVFAVRQIIRVVETLVPSAVYFDGRKAISEFSSLIQSQLDLVRECDNLQQFRYNFRDFVGVAFPQPAPSITTRDVLVETFEDGLPLQNFHCSANNSDIAEIGCSMFLKMLFEDNFVHSDLHPGNILVRQRPAPTGGAMSRELVVLDPGLVTRLSSRERDNFISLFAAVACGDGELGAALMLDRLPDSACPNREKFQQDMKRIFDSVGPGTPGFRLSDIELGSVLGQILNTVRTNRTPIDGNFAPLVVTVIIGEALGRKLQSNFNIFAEAAPYMMKYLENSELKFLVTRLHETYGAAALLRDTMSLDKTNTYVNIAAKKGKSTIFGYMRGD